ncbi:MAG: hypothetical protein FWC85_00115 [Elusimicrobia bacterium]|nr:hypothetical protein [Elusimicrobiota bacterium]
MPVDLHATNINNLVNFFNASGITEFDLTDILPSGNFDENIFYEIVQAVNRGEILSLTVNRNFIIPDISVSEMSEDFKWQYRVIAQEFFSFVQGLTDYLTKNVNPNSELIFDKLFYEKDRMRIALNVGLWEMLKNAIAHGYYGQLNKPLFIYIDKTNATVNVLNKIGAVANNNAKALAKITGVHGHGGGIIEVNNNHGASYFTTEYKSEEIQFDEGSAFYHARQIFNPVPSTVLTTDTTVTSVQEHTILGKIFTSSWARAYRFGGTTKGLRHFILTRILAPIFEQSELRELAELRIYVKNFRLETHAIEEYKNKRNAFLMRHLRYRTAVAVGNTETIAEFNAKLDRILYSYDSRFTTNTFASAFANVAMMFTHSLVNRKGIALTTDVATAQYILTQKLNPQQIIDFNFTDLLMQKAFHDQITPGDEHVRQTITEKMQRGQSALISIIFDSFETDAPILPEIFRQDVAGIIYTLAGVLVEKLHISEYDLQWKQEALKETIKNAYIHGNNADPSKKIWIFYDGANSISVINEDIGRQASLNMLSQITAARLYGAGVGNLQARNAYGSQFARIHADGKNMFVVGKTIKLNENPTFHQALEGLNESIHWQEFDGTQRTNLVFALPDLSNGDTIFYHGHGDRYFPLIAISKQNGNFQIANISNGFVNLATDTFEIKEENGIYYLITNSHLHSKYSINLSEHNKIVSRKTFINLQTGEYVFERVEMENNPESEQERFLEFLTSAEGQAYAFLRSEESIARFYAFFDNILNLNLNGVTEFKIVNRFFFSGRNIVEVAYPNGQRHLFYKSSQGTYGKQAGVWYPLIGIATGNDGFRNTYTSFWFVKTEEIQNFYSNEVFRATSTILPKKLTQLQQIEAIAVPQEAPWQAAGITGDFRSIGQHLTTETTLDKWYSKLILRFLGENGLRIIQVAIAPFAERRELKNVFLAGLQGKTSQEQEFLENHSGYNETTRKQYEKGLNQILSSAKRTYERFSRFKILQNIALNIALIWSHFIWNAFGSSEARLTQNINAITARNIANLRAAVINDRETSIVFVCSENMNRSAVANVLFRQFLRDNGKKNIEVFSAGIDYYSSIQNNSLSLEYKNILRGQVDIDILNRFKSEYLGDTLIATIPNFIITVDEEHRQTLLQRLNALGVHPNVLLFSELSPELPQLQHRHMPDPLNFTDNIRKEELVNLINQIFKDNFKTKEQQIATNINKLIALLSRSEQLTTDSPADFLLICGHDNADIFKKALQLYNEGATKRIIISGGFGWGTMSLLERTAKAAIPVKISNNITISNIADFENKIGNLTENQQRDFFSANGLSEAKIIEIVLRHHAYNMGIEIAAGDLILETQARHTGENFTLTRDIILEYIIENARPARPIRLAYMQIPVQQLRTHGTFMQTFAAELEQGKIEGISITIPYVHERRNENLSETDEQIQSIAGELLRMLIYSKHNWGDNADLKIPSPVTADVLPVIIGLIENSQNPQAIKTYLFRLTNHADILRLYENFKNTIPEYLKLIIERYIEELRIYEETMRTLNLDAVRTQIKKSMPEEGTTLYTAPTIITRYSLNRAFTEAITPFVEQLNAPELEGLLHISTNNALHSTLSFKPGTSPYDIITPENLALLRQATEAASIAAGQLNNVKLTGEFIFTPSGVIIYKISNAEILDWISNARLALIEVSEDFKTQLDFFHITIARLKTTDFTPKQIMRLRAIIAQANENGILNNVAVNFTSFEYGEFETLYIIPINNNFGEIHLPLNMTSEEHSVEAVQTNFIDGFISTLNSRKIVAYIFRQIIKFKMGFGRNINSNATQTVFFVYATEANLQEKIKQYGLVDGVVFIVNDVIRGNSTSINISANRAALREWPLEISYGKRVFSANGVSHTEIAQTLQNSRMFSDISAFVVIDSENATAISFEGDMIKVGHELIEQHRTTGSLADYITGLSNLQREWRETQANKNILDISNFRSFQRSAGEVLRLLATQNALQPMKVMLNEKQLEKLENYGANIRNLRLFGVEIFLNLGNENTATEQKASYANTGISGIFSNGVLTSLSTGITLPARTFHKIEDLGGLSFDAKLSDNFQGYNIIDINFIQDEINSMRSILAGNNILSALQGWFGKTFFLNEITKQDATNMAHKLEFSEAVRITGEALTKDMARPIAANLHQAQIMRSQLDADTYEAYIETLTARILVLNMIERTRAEQNLIQSERLIIEQDTGRKNTLTTLIVKDETFNGIEFLQNASSFFVASDDDFTFGQLIMQGLSGNATQEQIKQAIAVVISDSFRLAPVLDITSRRQRNNAHSHQIAGTRAILAAA